MCQDTGTAIVKGKKGQFVFTGGGDEAAIARGIYDTYQTSNLRYCADGAARHVHREEHRHEPAGGDQDLGDRRRRLQVPVHGQGRRLGEQELPLPGDQGAAQRGRRCSPGSSTRCSRSARRRVRRTTSPSSSAARRRSSRVETAKLASTRYLDSLPTTGSPQGHALPRPRPRTAGVEAVAEHRHRRPVRGQVLLPRRAHHPPAAPRRIVPGRHCGVVLGRPPGTRQDHQGRRVPRAARTRSRSVPARDRRRAPRRCRDGAHRPQPADGRHPRRAVAVPGHDPGDADRPDGRRPRHRPREDQGAPRRGRADAAVPPRSRRVLRGARPRRPRATHRVRSDRPPRAAWTATSSSSRRPAAR